MSCREVFGIKFCESTKRDGIVLFIKLELLKLSNKLFLLVEFETRFVCIVTILRGKTPKARDVKLCPNQLLTSLKKIN